MENGFIDFELKLTGVYSDIMKLQTRLLELEHKVHKLETATPDEECGCDSQDN